MPANFKGMERDLAPTAHLGEWPKRLLRIALLGASLLVPAAAVTVSPTEAHASVSIAVGFDALVKDADVVAVVTPVESKSLWEDGRITTYTRVKVEQAVAGELGTGGEGWVRTLGGVVGKIGQLVDGEPVFVTNKSTLVFMHKFKTGGTYEVSARAQGQYPIVIDDVTKSKKLIRSANVGMLYPPKAKAPTVEVQGPLQPQTNGSTNATLSSEKIKLAQEVLHERAFDEATRDIAAAWKRLHPAPAK